LAEHWDLLNTGIFYSKDVASGREWSSKKNDVEKKIILQVQ
jgi:hypothetical protein